MKTVREVEIPQCLQHFRAVRTLISIIIENLGESGFIELSRCIFIFLYVANAVSFELTCFVNIKEGNIMFKKVLAGFEPGRLVLQGAQSNYCRITTPAGGELPEMSC